MNTLTYYDDLLRFKLTKVFSDFKNIVFIRENLTATYKKEKYKFYITHKVITFGVQGFEQPHCSNLYLVNEAVHRISDLYRYLYVDKTDPCFNCHNALEIYYSITFNETCR